MIVKGKSYNDIEFTALRGDALIKQEEDNVVIDKQQARQLIEVLQKWVDGEEV